LLTKSPQDFRRTERNVEDMKLDEAERWIESLRASGVPARREETLYQERFSFALTPLIVGMLSIPIGGRFKKNILLSSLLVSLGFAVVYFVFKMIGGLLATLGYISPVVGAWAGVFVFALAGIILLRNSHT